MRLIALASLLAGLLACASDTKLSPETQEVPEPVETGEPDVEEPADEEPPDEDPPADTDEPPPPPPQKPIADCRVTPGEVSPPFEVADFQDMGSYDPNGGTIVNYSWTLVSAPAGTTAVMMGGAGAPNRSITPDLAGDYIGELVVESSTGLFSDPCVAVLTSTPVQTLWVEMHWQHSGDDMDLHLLKGNASYESSNDCYYGNCKTGLSWDAAGTQDDPYLDLDDIIGVGPENINITAPGSPMYKVVVHDYPGSTYNGANNVTVNIYMDGGLVWTDTRAISGEDSYTEFAQINWTTRSVTTL